MTMITIILTTPLHVFPNKNVYLYIGRLIPWSDDGFENVNSIFMDMDISILGSNETRLNVSEGIGQHVSKCSSNASGSSGNRSLSSQFDTFLNGEFKRILVVGELGM